MKIQLASLVMLAAVGALGSSTASHAFVLNELCVNIAVVEIIAHKDGSSTVILSNGTKHHVPATANSKG